MVGNFVDSSLQETLRKEAEEGLQDRVQEEVHRRAIQRKKKHC